MAHTPDSFRHSVAQTCRDLATVVRRRDTAMVYVRQHAQALDLLAGYVQNSLDHTDDLLAALAACQPTRDGYEPGPKQAAILGNLGSFGPDSDAASMLHALLAAAVDDLAATLRGRISDLGAARDREAVETFAARQELEQNQSALARIPALEAENDELRREVLRYGRAASVLGQIPTDSDSGGRRPSDSKHTLAPNVYLRPRADGGMSLQVAARDVQSRTFSSPDEALAYREELVQDGKLAPLPAGFDLATALQGVSLPEPAGLDGVARPAHSAA